VGEADSLISVERGEEILKGRGIAWGAQREVMGKRKGSRKIKQRNKEEKVRKMGKTEIVEEGGFAGNGVFRVWALPASVDWDRTGEKKTQL